MQIGKRTVVAKTCLVCGLLKMAHEFTIRQKYYRDSYCAPCHTKVSAPVTRRGQEKALKAASRHRELWSDPEIEKLEAMMSEGATGPQMAHALGRSVYAIYTMKNKVLRGIV